jgi:hypothetical protein
VLQLGRQGGEQNGFWIGGRKADDVDLFSRCLVRRVCRALGKLPADLKIPE